MFTIIAMAVMEDRIPKQDRAIRTRQLLLAAAAVEFDLHGYLSTRLVDIASRAGVTRGSLYFHFDSKATVAAALVAHQYEQWAGYVPARRVEGYRGIRLLMLFAHDLVLGFRDDGASRAAIALVKDARQIEVELPTPFPGWVRQVDELLREARGDGELGLNVVIDDAAWLVVANIFGVQEMCDQLEQRQGICERLDSLWLYLLPGLGVADAAGYVAEVIRVA